MARGRKRTTGKYQTVEELEEMVQFFSQTQGEFQTARTCGVSPTTVKNILERLKEKGEGAGKCAEARKQPAEKCNL